MAKLRAPEGVTSINHGGITLKVGPDGSLDGPHDALAPHGFTLWDAPNRDFDGLSRAEIVAHLQTLSTPDLASLLAEASAKTRKNAEKEADVSGNPTPEQIDAMSRNDMFAYLKQRGVAVSLPVTNEELREIARKTAADQPHTKVLAKPA